MVVCRRRRFPVIAYTNLLKCSFSALAPQGVTTISMPFVLNYPQSYKFLAKSTEFYYIIRCVLVLLHKHNTGIELCQW